MEAEKGVLCRPGQELYNHPEDILSYLSKAWPFHYSILCLVSGPISQITAKLSFPSLFSAKIKPACSYTAGYKKEEILDLMSQLGGTFMGILCH
jgi:hypothetical protein